MSYAPKSTTRFSPSLDALGFVKLCDFGFARKLHEDRAYTRCGTPEYTSPEMLLSEGVNGACDWWALGIVLCEMLTGSRGLSCMMRVL